MVKSARIQLSLMHSAGLLQKSSSQVLGTIRLSGEGGIRTRGGCNPTRHFQSQASPSRNPLPLKHLASEVPSSPRDRTEARRYHTGTDGNCNRYVPGPFGAV